MTLPGLLKTKLLLARHGRRVTIALAILGVLAFGVAGWLFVTPGSTEVVEQRNEQHVQASLDTSAVVTGNSTVWTPGTTLQNKPVYLLSATPNLTLASKTSVPRDQPVDVSQRVLLVYRVERSGQVVWKSKELLLADTTRVSDGNATAKTTLDVKRIERRVSEIQNEFAGIGTVTTHLQLHVNYETNRYEDELNASGTVAFADRAIAIDDHPSVERTHATPVTTTQQAARDWLSLSALVGLALAAFAGAAYSRRLQKRGVDEKALERRIRESRYVDWISEGRLPANYDGYVVRMDSLDALVNLAIDSQKRVVRDDRQDVFGVIDGDTAYYYFDHGYPPPFVTGSKDADDAEGPDEETGKETQKQLLADTDGGSVTRPDGGAVDDAKDEFPADDSAAGENDTDEKAAVTERDDAVDDGPSNAADSVGDDRSLD